MIALSIISLLLVAFMLAVAALVVRAQWANARDRRADRARRAAGERAVRDFTATVRGHLTESVEEWAERTGNTVPPRPVPRLPEPGEGS